MLRARFCMHIRADLSDHSLPYSAGQDTHRIPDRAPNKTSTMKLRRLSIAQVRQSKTACIGPAAQPKPVLLSRKQLRVHT